MIGVMANDEMNGSGSDIHPHGKWFAPHEVPSALRLKVEGFDYEGRAVPMTGPLVVFMPMHYVSMDRIARLTDSLPKGSFLVGVDGELTSVMRWDDITDEVLVEEARRRWGSSLGALPEQLLKGLRDMSDVAARVTERVEMASATWEPRTPEQHGAAQEHDQALDEREIAEVFAGLEMGLDNPPPHAVIRGWTSEERAAASTWGWMWYEWAGSGSEGEEPEQPAHLKHALDFLANGTIKLGGAS